MPIIDEAALKKLLPDVLKKSADTAIVKLKYIGSGSYGKAFRAQTADGQMIVIKAYRIPEMNVKEAEALKILSRHTHVKMPKVLFTLNNDDVELLGMSLIEGCNAMNPLFLFKGAEKRNRFARAVADGMLEWHSVKGEKYGAVSDADYDSWHDYYRETKLSGTIAGLADKAVGSKSDMRKYDLICTAAERFEKEINEPEYPVLIHGDLNIMNIMADKRTFELTGFIDPCGCSWADRDYDLFQLRNIWGDRFGLIDAYKAIADIDEKSFDFKIAFYGAVNEVSCRLETGVYVPYIESLWFSRLKKIMKI